jgi:hypothetical protein
MDEKVIVAYRWDVLAEIKGRNVELPVLICLLIRDVFRRLVC